MWREKKNTEDVVSWSLGVDIHLCKVNRALLRAIEQSTYSRSVNGTCRP